MKIFNLFIIAFEEAEKNAPAIIFIDELDAIAPKRDKVCMCRYKVVVGGIYIAIDTWRGREKDCISTTHSYGWTEAKGTRCCHGSH